MSAQEKKNQKKQKVSCHTYGKINLLKMRKALITQE